MKKFEIAGIPVEINNGKMKVYAFDRKFKSQFEERVFCFKLCRYCETEGILKKHGVNEGQGVDIVLVKDTK